MMANSVASPAPRFAPLAPLLRAAEPDKLNQARRRIIDLPRQELIDRFGKAFADEKPLVAFILSEELNQRGIPPCFRHLCMNWDAATIDQKFLLLTMDLRWLRRWHESHVKAVRYQRLQAMLSGTEAVFHREAEYLFYGGKRPAWKMVRSLSLTERQQWECAWLRSEPIKKRAQATGTASAGVFLALQNGRGAKRRTAAYGEVEAGRTHARRLALWQCSRMERGAGPTVIAERYTQLTGEPITRQAAAKQLEKIRLALRESEMTS